MLGVGRGQVKKLEDTNNYILRPYNHYSNINMVGIKTLEQGGQFQALVLVIIRLVYQ